MKEKLKIEGNAAVSVLDSISCGCGSCEDDKVEVKRPIAPPVQANVLDDIGCG